MNTEQAQDSPIHHHPAGFDLPRAVRAVRALVANPDDTALAFEVIEAMAGRAPERNRRRFARTPVGKRVLGERPSLLAVLSDRPRLEALDPGSLGRAYLRFMDSEGITAGGLVEASVEGTSRVDSRDSAHPPQSEREVFADWLRDSHDLWHTVTGYKGDLIGEASLLAFSFAQTRHPGVGLIVLGALLRTTLIARVLNHDGTRAPVAEADPALFRKMVLRGFRRGARAQWLVAQDWEALLPLPLHEVRLRLGLDAPPQYTPLRSDALRPQQAAA